MITRGRRVRLAIGLFAGWAMAILLPGVVAGLVVYQVNVTRIAPAVPTLVSGIRAEVTVVDAEAVLVTPVMHATLIEPNDAANVADGDAGDGTDDGPSYAADEPIAVPLHEALPGTVDAAMATDGAHTGSAGAGALSMPIQPTHTGVATGTTYTLSTETMTPLPLGIDDGMPTITIEPLPTPTLAATELIEPTPESTPTLLATETIAPTIAPIDTWTPVPTFEATPIPATPVPTETAMPLPVPVEIPAGTATTSPLESPLATPTTAPSATPVETETPSP